MIKDAALVTISCVLFVNMGLSGAIQDTINIHSKILSCPKCCTMWSCLAVLLAKRYGVIESVAASFISSYCALWMTLVYDFIAVLYNDLYELFTEKPDAAEGDSAETDDKATTDPDAVSKM